MTNTFSLKAAVAIAVLTAALTGCGNTEQAAANAEAGAEAARAGKSSSAGLPVGHVEAGQKLASAKNATTGQSCVDCHGAEGNAPIDASYPRLAGQYDDYLAYSLLGYRDGRREHALMSSQATDLTDQQIADLAAYFSTRAGNLRDLHNANN